MLRIGVVGFGKMGALHAATLNAMAEAKVVAVSETNAFVRHAVESLTAEIHTYARHEEMLEKEKLNAVVITTPVSFHAPIARDCIEKGVAVLIEKPMAANFADAARVADEASRRNLQGLVAYPLRYIDTFRKGHEILDAKVLSPVQWVTASIYVTENMKKTDNWLYDKKLSGGGALIGLGCHIIDTLLWYFGVPESVIAVTSAPISGDIEDFAHCMFRYPTGLAVSVEVSWSVHTARLVQPEIMVHAANGALHVTRNSLALYLTGARGGYAEGWTQLSKADVYGGAEFAIAGPEYSLEARELVNALQKGTKPTSDLASGAMTQQVMEALYRSVETSRMENVAAIRGEASR
jgi:predicted dehydrogenase